MKDKSILNRIAGLAMLLVLVVVAGLSLAMLYPRSVTASSAPPTVFSGARAMAHLPAIAGEPHPAGSPAQMRVRDYILQQLSAMRVQAEVQKTTGAENVVARLRGTDPTGAIVVLAHYDSQAAGPGAADNASGVAALLEVMRALAAGPAPRNEVIALFDDAEEGRSSPFNGTWAFVREHPWMKDVRVAVSLDTAVGGPISTNETGTDNGWLVQALARAYTGGAWTSISGGGQYDSYPFRQSGIQALALEDNYPFKEKHTADDVVGIVNPGSVQQMGEQTLAIARELGQLDLGNPRAEHETFFTVPLLGLFHYPEAWTLPLAIAGGVLLVIALGLALWRRFVSWRGLLVAFVSMIASAGLAAAIIGALVGLLPDLIGWNTNAWPDWPEIIPPNAEIIYGLFGLVVLALALGSYVMVRRWTVRADWSLIGLLPFLLLAVVVALTTPRGAYFAVWPVLIGSLVWIPVAIAGKTRMAWSVDLATLLVALPLLTFVLPLIPGIVMSDGLKSVAILAAILALLLGVVFPAIEGGIARERVRMPSGAIIKPL